MICLFACMPSVSSSSGKDTDPIGLKPYLNDFIKPNLCVLLSCFSQVSDSLWPYELCLPDSSVHGDPPGKNSGLPHLPSGGLPNPGIEPVSLVSPGLEGRIFTAGQPWKPHLTFITSLKVLSPNTITLVVRASAHEFRGTQFSLGQSNNTFRSRVT